MRKDVIHTHLDIRRNPDGKIIHEYGARCNTYVPIHDRVVVQPVAPKTTTPTTPQPAKADVRLELGKVYMEPGFYHSTPFVCVGLEDRWRECRVMFFDGAPGLMASASGKYIFLANSIQNYVAGVPYPTAPTAP